MQEIRGLFLKINKTSEVMYTIEQKGHTYYVGGDFYYLPNLFAMNIFVILVQLL
jgi:hypothetical protein